MNTLKRAMMVVMDMAFVFLAMNALVVVFGFFANLVVSSSHGHWAATGSFARAERRACRVIGQPRVTQRYEAHVPDDEAMVMARIVALASEYGRYGYRRITAWLRREGWTVNHKRVERIWRREGLKVPTRQPKRGRRWLMYPPAPAICWPRLELRFHAGPPI
jgi:transposase InsO family protein